MIANISDEVLMLRSGYAQHKRLPERAYRFLTFEECRSIPGGATVHFIDNKGEVRTARVTSVQTWKSKKRLGDVRIGIKYGLYEYAYIRYVNGEHSMGVRLITPIEGHSSWGN